MMLHCKLCNKNTYKIPTEKETCEDRELDGDTYLITYGH